MFKRIVLAALVAACTPFAVADPQLMVAHSWARALPVNAVNAAVYLHIHNSAPEADTLLSATSPVAKNIELHTVEQVGDVMKMAQVQNIQVKPGEHLKLAPGGLHLMLFGLNTTLSAGATFPLELTFANAGQVSVTVEVLAQAPQSAAQHKHHH